MTQKEKKVAIITGMTGQDRVSLADFLLLVPYPWKGAESMIKQIRQAK